MQAGFSNVFALEGGFDAWKNAGLSLTGKHDQGLSAPAPHPSA